MTTWSQGPKLNSHRNRTPGTMLPSCSHFKEMPAGSQEDILGRQTWSEACLAFKTFHTHLSICNFGFLTNANSKGRVPFCFGTRGNFKFKLFWYLCLPFISQFSLILFLCLTCLSRHMWLRASLSTSDHFSLSLFCFSQETCDFGPPVLTAGIDSDWLASDTSVLSVDGDSGP